MAKDKDPREHVTIGFQAGGSLALRLTEKDRVTLLDALAKGDWLDLDDVEGPVRVNLSQVVYVRTENAEQHVGFGLG
ncbi:MAG TPA: hypothetical protein VMT10_14945 [Solirubrobacteraceae bacterium]|nr:hypothetical protein [Solirubrobacteraceae bacterium]